MKKIILLGIILLMVSVVGAVDFEPEKDITLYAEYTINGVFSESDASLTIIAPNGTISIDNQTMTEIATGRFSYEYITPEEIGQYYFTVRFYNNDTLLGIDSYFIDIGIFDKLVFGSCPDTKQGQSNMWIVVILLIVLGIFAILTKNLILIFVSGGGLIFMTLIVWGCGDIIGYITMIVGIVYIFTGLSIKT